MNMQLVNLALLTGLALLFIGCGAITYRLLQQMPGALERAFIWRASTICGLGAVLAAAGLIFIPAPWKYGILVIYLLKIATLTPRWYRRRLELRTRDTTGKLEPAVLRR